MPTVSGAHTRHSTDKGLDIIVNELGKSRIFAYVGSRKHRKFANPQNILYVQEKESAQISYLLEALG